MKKLENVQQRLDVIYKVNVETLSKKEEAALRREVTKLELTKKYLETDPSEEFIQNEIYDNEREIAILENGYGKWLESTPQVKNLKNPKSKFNNELGITNKNKQITLLKFILKN
jgi:hypothetical protein